MPTSEAAAGSAETARATAFAAADVQSGLGTQDAAAVPSTIRLAWRAKRAPRTSIAQTAVTGPREHARDALGTRQRVPRARIFPRRATETEPRTSLRAPRVQRVRRESILTDAAERRAASVERARRQHARAVNGSHRRATVRVRRTRRCVNRAVSTPTVPNFVHRDSIGIAAGPEMTPAYASDASANASSRISS